MSGGFRQALKVLESAYMKGTQKSEWSRELIWAEEQLPEIVEYYVWIVEEFNKRLDYREEQIQELTKIVVRGAQKQKISWDIDVSIQ